MRPARRCQERCRRRRPAENWKAPNIAKTMALTMSITTGSGDAEKWGLAGSTVDPVAKSTRRSEPARTGMVPRAIGTRHVELRVAIRPRLAALAVQRWAESRRRASARERQ